MGYLLTSTFAALVGFAAGLISYRQSRRWCGVCGATLTCARCVQRDIQQGIHRGVGPRNPARDRRAAAEG